jgi:hypothetical protein
MHDQQPPFWQSEHHRSARSVTQTRRTASALVVALVVALLAAAAVVPPKATAAEVTIQNPVEGEEYPAPYTGPLTVDFTGAPIDTYTLRVSGSGYTWEVSHTYDGTNNSFSQAFPAITSAGTYSAAVTDSAQSELAAVSFTVAVDDATIVSPSQGQTFFAPFSGPISVRWDSIADPSDSYRVDIRRNGSLVDRCNYSGTGLEARTTSCWTSIGEGIYDVDVWNAGGGAALDHVSVKVIRHLRLTDVSARPATFYPLIRDGYRDTTSVRFLTNKTARGRIRVISRSTGRTVKRVDLGFQLGGQHAWKWNGRNDAGKKVEPGYYRVEVIASSSGETRTVARTVRAHTRVLRKYFTKSKRGTGYQSRGKIENCNFGHIGGELLLTCLYGIAWADYAFGMSPGSLRHIVRGPVIDGAGFRYRHGEVRCHPRSAAKRRGRKVLLRFISNGSNGWSQCLVVDARIKYHYFFRQ